MTHYATPVEDMRFALDHVADFANIQALPGYEEVTKDLVSAILEQAGRFGVDVLAPLNQSGDQEGAVFESGTVRMPEGFADAYKKFIEGGWNSLPFPREVGGQALPWVLHTAVQEIWHAANMSFGLCPMLTQSAVELLLAHASYSQKALFLPRLVSGEWTGSMNLTESQAGSDLSRIRTRAIPIEESDTYRLIGQKVFITYGEHDMTENIIHLVLARIQNAPSGVKGISLFIVPKFLVASDGSLESRNDIWCYALEHKLGIRASPTAAMSLGDDEGAIGYLVGRAHCGLEYMFTMMNHARLSVGLEGVALAERAYQQARNYARERVQGYALQSGSGSGAVSIIHHPDVRRMLMTMKALTEATRALSYYTAAQVDVSRSHPNPDVRGAAYSRVSLLTPIVKAWSTDVGIEVANIGLQVHGGAGFIETTGAAQYLRDARISAIYEGTNGIQAHDLVSRKVLRDGGRVAQQMIVEINAVLLSLAGRAVQPLQTSLQKACAALEKATAWLVAHDDPVTAQAGAVPYLHLFGLTLGGFMFAKAALAGAQLSAVGNHQFLNTKLMTARFYAERLLPQTESLLKIVTTGAESIMAVSEEAF